MSKTKIKLEEPFKSLWKFGYLNIDKDGRKYIRLYKSDKIRKSISYARYLYSVYLGYEVPEEFEVDHKNDDHTDDRIDNYQLITRPENIKKRHKNYRDNIQLKQKLNCYNCNCEFFVPMYEYKRMLKRNSKNFYCNRTCYNDYFSAKKLSCDYCNVKLDKNDFKYKTTNTVTKEEKYYCSEQCFKNFVNMHSV